MASQYDLDKCWGDRISVFNPNRRFMCHKAVETALGLCHDCHKEIIGCRALPTKSS